MKQNSIEYYLDLNKDQIDDIDDNFITSTLSVYDYYTFYGIISGRYSNQYKDDIETYLEKYDLQEHRNTPICELEFGKQLVIRAFITKKKRATIIYLRDFNGIVKESDIIVVHDMLNARCITKNKSFVVNMNDDLS